jgi:hypothetical protein
MTVPAINKIVSDGRLCADVCAYFRLSVQFSLEVREGWLERDGLERGEERGGAEIQKRNKQTKHNLLHVGP